MTSRRCAALAVAAAAWLTAPAAFAQPGDPSSRLEIGIGELWMARQPLGRQNATETTAAGAALTQFTATSELGGVAGLAGRAGVRVARSVVVEAEASYLQPQLRIALSGDTEGAAPVTATETVQQFTMGGGVLWYVPVVQTRRLAPFLTGGGGYLRQLHEQATLVQTGRYYQFGGGVSALLVSRRHFHTKGVGARLDARAVVRSKGVAFDVGSKTSAAVGVSAFVRF